MQQSFSFSWMLFSLKWPQIEPEASGTLPSRFSVSRDRQQLITHPKKDSVFPFDLWCFLYFLSWVWFSLLFSERSSECVWRGHRGGARDATQQIQSLCPFIDITIRTNGVKGRGREAGDVRGCRKRTISLDEKRERKDRLTLEQDHHHICVVFLWMSSVFSSLWHDWYE